MAQQKCGLLDLLRWHKSMYIDMKKCSLYYWMVKASCERYGVRSYLCFWKKCKDQSIRYVYFCDCMSIHLEKWQKSFKQNYVSSETWSSIRWKRTKGDYRVSFGPMCCPILVWGACVCMLKILENIPTRLVQTVLCLRSPLGSHQEQI